MANVQIEFMDTPELLTEDFDRLGREMAEVIARLLPGAVVRLTYVQEKPVPGLGGITGVSTSLSAAAPQGKVIQHFEEVRGHSGWWRQITVELPSHVCQFFGIESGITGGFYDTIAITLDVARAWASAAAKIRLQEIKVALAQQLPVWIVAHVAAGAIYDSQTYSRAKKHDALAQRIARTLEYMISLAASRVEHRELSHGVIIGPIPRGTLPLSVGRYPEDFQPLKRTPLLADGVRSALRIGPEGQLVSWCFQEGEQWARGERPNLARGGGMGFMLDLSKRVRGIGVMLRPDGSIVMLRRGHPLFVRRGGKWHGLLWDPARRAVRERYSALGELIFDTAVLLASRGEGGVLALLDQPSAGLHDKDIVDLARSEISGEVSPSGHGQYDQEAPPEWLFHALLPTTNVEELGPAALAVLASIDGATIVDRSGKLRAYGAVVPSSPSGAEGARSAAARELSKEGFVIKVSADGPITLFERGTPILDL